MTAKIQEYAATSMNLSTRDEIYSAMVVYGFLSYLNGKVCIPNRELMEKFDELLVKNESLGYVYRLAKESEKMLKATLARIESPIEPGTGTSTSTYKYPNLFSKLFSRDI